MTATDPTVIAMYRALLEAPDGEKDTVALVLADAIEESGEDPARAELIRLQVQLSSIQLHIPMQNRERVLRARESALLKLHRDRWLKVDCPKCVKGFEKHPKTGEVIEQWCRACNRTCDETRLTEECSYCAGGGQGFSEGSKCIACKGSGRKRQVSFKRGFPWRADGAVVRAVVSHGGRQFGDEREPARHGNNYTNLATHGPAAVVGDTPPDYRGSGDG